jgi:hypothetical protein
MEMKYVRHKVLGFMLWPKNSTNTHPAGLLTHYSVGQLLNETSKQGVISAGFCVINNGVVYCYGKSESLNIESRLDDSKELAIQLGLKHE